MDKLVALKVFCRVAELGSFVAAARDLGLSNAAVSKNVSELEQELAVRLINRTTRRLHLTDAGSRYLALARDVLAGLADADAAVAESTGPPRGHLRVAAPMSVGLTIVGPLIADFLLRYPEVTIDLDLDDRFVDVVDGGFDLVIRGAARLKDSTLVVRRIASFDRLLCASHAYLEQHGTPERPEDLRAHRCLIYTLSSTPSLWTFHRGTVRSEVEVNGPLRTNNSLVLANAAAQGLGIARLPVFAASELMAKGSFSSILAEWQIGPSALFAISPKHRQASRNIRLLVDHLTSSLR